MNRLTRPALRHLLGRGCLFIAATLSMRAADVYLTVNGAGAENGSSWADAYPASSLVSAVGSLAAGDTLHIGSGTYATGAGPVLVINSSGSAGAPKTIQGVDTGGGLPVFQGTYNVNNTASSSDTFLSFSGSTAHWVFKDFSLENYGFPVRMNPSGTTYTLRNNLTFENIDGQNCTDFFQIQNASQVTLIGCDVVRYKKKGFRYADYIEYLTFDSCSADANGGDDTFPTLSIPAGFVGGDTDDEPRIHDVTLIDCVARNNRFVQSAGTYWNGDGFSTEEATYNVTYTRCLSFDNHDGGFDDKADNVTYVSSVAIGNAKGFRYWGNNGVYINCLSAYNKAWGGTNASDGIWVGAQTNGNVGVAHIYLSTFHNNDKWALESYDNGEINVTDSILSVDGVWTNGNLEETTNDITLTNTARYRASAGLLPDPQYSAPSRSWTGTPANAFDSAVYSPTQGYYSLYAPTVGPVATITASDPAAGEPSNDGAFTVSVSPAPSSTVMVNLDVNGTASAGSDYTAIGTSVAVGSAGTAVVDVTVLDDSVVESAETVVVALLSGTGYDVGTQSSGTVTIADDDVSLPTITVTAIDDDAAEPYYDGKYRLTASPAPSGELTLNVTMSGTATNGTDYKSIANHGTLTMGSSGTLDVLLDVTNDYVVESDETAVLTVTAGSGYVVGVPGSASITIVDNDVMPVVNATLVDSTAAEPGNNGKFRLKATPSPGTPLVVNIAMSGTATNGVDYVSIPATRTLSSSGVVEFVLDVNDDSITEGSETAILTVLPGTGYTVGSSATLTITDND